MRKIDFEFVTELGTYKDALYLIDGVTYTDQDIERLKQERLAAWVSLISSPPPEEE